jgi:hypothetical protein
LGLGLLMLSFTSFLAKNDEKTTKK